MADSSGDKTEQATGKRLEQAHAKGQFARSAEVQTVFVLMAALMALTFYGGEIWRTLGNTQISMLSHLHDTPLTADIMQSYAIRGALVLAQCVWPVLVATILAGMLAGGLQTRFQTSPEAMDINWDRLNPATGFQRLFSMRAGVPTLINIVKLLVIIGLTYSVIKSILADPIFYTSVDVARIAGFMADSSFKLITRVGLSLIVLAAGDYGYQYWRTNKDMMMTKEEVKEETKNAEGNPHVKTHRRRRQIAIAKRKMLKEVPKADVIVVNPIHIAVALRYDRKTMKAPRIVAKGSRLNATRIREIAAEHQIPIVENIPLARLMFKYGRVGGEIPAELYSAVAEILAWVYRVNAYRYYRERSLQTN
jgi:flagellar biosynthetic protein FlhB